MANDAILVVDEKSGRVMDANPRALDLLDRKMDEVRGKLYKSFLPACDRSGALGIFCNIADAGPEGNATIRLERPDGWFVHCEVTARRTEIDGKRCLLGFFRDISERLRANEDIHLRNVAIASVGTGVTIADARHPDLPLIYVNRGFEQITGYSAKEAVGRSCRFLQADDRDQAALEVLRTSLRKGEHCNVRLRNYRKDGALFWNELIISPVRNEEGDLTHFIGIQIDVTDRVLARERLEASERRYRVLADNIEDLILRVDPQGMIDFVSPSSIHFLGAEPEAVIGRNFFCWVDETDREDLAGHWRSLEREAGTMSKAFCLKRQKGEPIWVESRDTRLPAGEGEGRDYIVAVMRDVTLRKRAEEDIRRALERERELNEIKTRFIRMVSHEFRTPMTGIRASSAFLRDFSDRLTAEKKQRHFRNIDNCLGRMNDMLNDVLFASRSEAGRVECKPRPTNLQSFGDDLVEQLQHIYGEERIVFDADLPSGVERLLDTALLQHILQNLLTNALKYSPPGARVLFRIEEQDDAVSFLVEDAGMGVPEADRESLFEPFHRAGNVGTIKGTGLGLYIAKRSVERHGGTIFYEPGPEKGSRFLVKLPAPAVPSPASVS
ncbi:MAG: PAS domain S-box protein [Opitutales bacterium]|nr:PAS domain S-box protein [Opitutales bacterium]